MSNYWSDYYVGIDKCVKLNNRYKHLAPDSRLCQGFCVETDAHR